MKKKLLSLCLLFVACQGAAIAAPPAADWLMPTRMNPRKIFVNNRVLKVNGRCISILDIQRKMDMVFYRQFPQYAEDPEARYQFYQINWRTVLQDMIDAELVLSDAAEKKIEISDGEIREELETLFGPNVISNIHSLGMSLDEAKEIIRKELTVSRMMLLMVRSKAMHQVTPSGLRHVYSEYAEANRRQASWEYQVLTIRASNPDQGAILGAAAQALLESGKAGFSTLISALEQEEVKDSMTAIRLSTVYQRNEEEIAESHRDILSNMSVGGYSAPVAQIDRTDNNTVYRIFHLINYSDSEDVTLKEVESRLKEFLLSKAMDSETDTYMNKLRRYYGISREYISQALPEDFQPFVLR